jgi:hypothetical protein
VLSHRLLLSSQTRLRGRSASDVLDEIIAETPVPIADHAPGNAPESRPLAADGG